MAGENDNNGGSSDIAHVAGALTAVVGVLTGLAVTGVLGQAQRNHGVSLLIGFGLVLFGAILWLGATLLPPDRFVLTQQWPRFNRTRRLLSWTLRRVGFKAFALLSFLAGLILAVNAMILTQRDSERPAVSASFDPKTRVLAVTATAHGLSTDDRLVALVSGVYTHRLENPPPGALQFKLIEDPRSLYYAVIGPDAGGDVSHAISVFVPRQYKLVGVKAWTGSRESECRTEEVRATKVLPQHAQAGCLLMRLPPNKN
jgi:hypothetical protein